MTTRLAGKVSWFGGPDDTGVSPSEGLAFIYDVDMAPHLFLPSQPPGTTGLARRLNPDKFYIACRWDYEAPGTSKTDLLHVKVLVRAPKTGRAFAAEPADWGPHENTGRVADISPGLMAALGIDTDDEVIVEFPYERGDDSVAVPYDRIAISSGHGALVRGASGVLDEVDEARRVVEAVADKLAARGVDVVTFHDDVSTTQSENLDHIVDWHNAQERELDVSVHFNAYVETTNPMGTEVLYVTQAALAGEMSAAIADAGDFIDRGGKKRTDLAFLNGTDKPAILIETCFVDSTADAALYEENFDHICEAIADRLGGTEQPAERPPAGGERPPHPLPPARPATVRVDIDVVGEVTVLVNGVPVT
jgi:N-acetylmuramoyl-L-alanine amidase